MKILFYIDSLSIGGAETQVVSQLIELKRSNIDTVLIVHGLLNTFLEEKAIKAGVRIEVLPRIKNRMVAIAFRKLSFVSTILNRSIWMKVLNWEKPDLIYINTSLFRIFGAKFPADRMIYTFHSEVQRTIEVYGNRNFKRLKALAKEGMHFFALTEHMACDIKQMLGTRNVTIIPNSIDVALIKQTGYKKQVFLPSIDIPTEAFVLGHVGRFHPVKNHERVISIFSEVRKKNANAYLALIGGYYEDRQRKIREYAKQLGVLEYIRFLGIRDDATQICNCFDCLLLPSFSESFSLAIIEAQAQMIRCVVSDSVPVDVVCNENCYRLSLDCDDAEWASLILKSENRHQIKDIMQFDNSVVVQKMISVFDAIIQSDSYYV